MSASSAPHWLQRTQLLLGEESIDQLRNLHVLVIGLGGVGSYAAEFLARAGVGRMTIVDGDTVDITNTNRQLPALHSTVGQAKAEVMAARIRDINPDIDLRVINSFLGPEEVRNLITPEFQYVFDCIDSIQPKQYIVVTCKQKGIRVVSSMGAGGRIDPSQVRVADISETYNCPFAQQVRKGLKRKGVRRGVTVVFSSELVDISTMMLTDGSKFKKSFYGTCSYIPALFGLHMASVVVKDIAAEKQKRARLAKAASRASE
ncbi:MAG: ThiF family adenylyltransferase [Bacteroidota bacterium]|jgi:tRNA A37 threonylcarbamoyladenosine dehydratase|nr:tRNA threonylcarbamoyladenosine dehydratase [Saprospiraceae bacterium]